MDGAAHAAARGPDTTGGGRAIRARAGALHPESSAPIRTEHCARTRTWGGWVAKKIARLTRTRDSERGGVPKAASRHGNGGKLDEGINMRVIKFDDEVNLC